MIMYLGAFLFMMIFVLLAPQSRAFLGSLAVGAGSFMSAWAPFSYLIVLILMAAMFAGIYVIHSWPARVDPENPMAKYRREAETTMDDE